MTQQREKKGAGPGNRFMAVWLVWLMVAGGFAGITSFGVDIGLDVDLPGVGTAAAEEYDMDSVVAMWKMDENSGDTVYDETANDNDGTRYGATWVDGRNGSGLEFDEDYVKFGDIDIPLSGTIEMWFKPSIDYDGSQETGKLWYKFHSIDMDFLPNGSIRSHVSPSEDSYVYSKERTYSADTWYHIAWAWGEKGEHLYINGIEEGSNTNTATAPDSTQSFYIGAGTDDIDPPSQFFYGLIDEAVIHDEALEPSEFYGMRFMPDLTIKEDSIELSSDAAVGKTVLLNATIENIGDKGIEHWQLTDDSTDYSWPSYSDSGKKIVYMYGGSGGNVYIYSMNFDGSGKTQLTNKENGEYEVYPDTSTDGTLISYGESKSGGGNFDIYVMELDGSSKTQVSSHSKRETHQTFGFDDQYMTYTAEQDGSSNYDIWVMKRSGADWDNSATAYQVTNDAAGEYVPVLFPGNDDILFAKNSKLWVASRDGAEWDEGVTVTQLTADAANYDRADVSPDGEKVLYISGNKDGGSTNDIWLMDSDGTDHIQLTSENYPQDYPRFNTDGSKIVYTSKEDGGSNFDLWQLNATATASVRFYDGDPDDGGTFIGKDRVALWKNSSALAQVEWTPTHASEHDIYVVVGEVAPGDSNWSNNVVVETVEVLDYNMSSVVGMWRMDEGEGDVAKDFSLNGNDGDITGATWGEGKNEKALELDGDGDYVSVPDDTSLDFGDGSFTGECWIKTSQHSFPDSFAQILRKRVYSSGLGWSVGMDDDGTIFLMVRDGSEEKSIFSKSSVNDNEWHHISGQRDGDSLRIFIDGVEETTGDCSNVGSVSCTDLLYFGRAPGTAGYFDGIIDEVVLHDKALKPSEFYGMRYYKPDLKVEESGIEFSEDPVVGEKVTINVTIDNIGYQGIGQWQITDEDVDQTVPGFSPDGAKIVFGAFDSGGDYDGIRLMDSDGTNMTKLTVATDKSTFPTFSPNGSYIYYAEGSPAWDIYRMKPDNTGREAIIEASGDQAAHDLNNYGQITYGCDSSHSGNYHIYIASDTGQGQTRLTDNAYYYTSSPSFNPENTRIIYSSNEGDSYYKVMELTKKGETWDSSCSKATLIEWADTNVQDPAFDSDGEMIVFRERIDSECHLWLADAQGKNPILLTSELRGQGNIGRGSFSPYGSKIIYQSKEDGGSYHDIWQLNATATASVRFYDGDPDDGGKLIGTDDIAVWANATAKAQIEWTPTTAGSVDIYVVVDDVLPGDGNLSNNKAFKTVDIKPFRHAQTLSDAHGDGVWGLAFSPNGTLLASGGGLGDKKIKIWDVETWRELRTLTGNTHSVESVAFSPDGEYLVSGSYSSELKVWRTSDWVNIVNMTDHTGSVYWVSFSPDGKYLSSASWDDTVIIWDTSDWSKLETLTDHTDEIECSEFSPNGTLLATASTDKDVRIWDTTRWTSIKTLGHAEAVKGVNFSPNGSYLASCGTDNDVYVWDTSDWSLFKTLSGHTDQVIHASFSPDGRYLVSGSEDDSFIVWDTTSWKQVQTLGEPGDYIDMISFSPDQGIMVGSGGAHDIYIYDYPVRLNTLSLSIQKDIYSPGDNVETQVLYTGDDIFMDVEASYPNGSSLTTDTVRTYESSEALFMDDLVGWWDFDEGEGTTAYDLSGNGNDGTLKNGPVWVEGVSGKALEFDGDDDCVSVADPGDLKLVNDFSVSFWFNTDVIRSEVKGDEGTYFLSCTADSQDSQYTGFAVDGYGGVGDLWDSVRVWKATGSSSLERLQYSGGHDGRWHHVVTVFSSTGGMLLFVDGELEESNAGFTSDVYYDSTSPYFWLGALNNDAGREMEYEGLLDDSQVYNTALTSDEISALYTLHSNKVNLSASWSFDEGSGNIARDDSGNSNDGEVKGASWVDGIEGKALDFDGEDDYISVTHDNTLNILDTGNGFSATAWIKSSGSTSTWQQIIRKGTGQYRYEFKLSDDRTKLRIICYDGVDDPELDATINADDGEWHHAAFTKSATDDKLRLYFDGTLEGTSTSDCAGSESSTDPLFIGSAGPDIGEYFNGIIDEPAVYDRALSAFEVTAIYNRTLESRVRECPITIENSLAEFLNDYQMKLEITDHEILNDMASNGSDLRFYEKPTPRPYATPYNGLPYWVESKNDTRLVVWVKLSLAARGEKIIYMYYGNYIAQNEGDGEGVFEFFDNFEGGSLDTDKWTKTGGHSYDISDGILHVETGGSTNDFIRRKSTGLTDDVIIDMKAKAQDDSDPGLVCRWDGSSRASSGEPTGYWVSEDPGVTGVHGRPRLLKLTSSEDTTLDYSDWDASTALYYIYSMGVDGSDLRFKIFDDKRFVERVDLSGTDLTFSDSGYLGIHMDCTDGESWIDWLHVRKHASSEPNVSVGKPYTINYRAAKIAFALPFDAASGNYTLSANTTDAWAETGFNVESSLRPTAVIDKITPNPILQGEELSFAGWGNYAEAIETYVWKSSLDGEIRNASSCNFTNSGLSLGQHLITLLVKGDDGTWSPAVTTYINVTTAPTAVVDSVAPNPALDTQTVEFRAWGEDDNSVDYCVWVSNLSGELHNGTDGNFSATVATGHHLLEFYVVDNHGFRSAIIEFYFNVSGKPTAIIDSLESNPALSGDTIYFNGTGTDDGSVERYVWKSNISGEFHNDTYPDITYDSLALGFHLITFIVQDGDGFWSAAVSQYINVTTRPVAHVDGFPDDPSLDTEELDFGAWGEDDVAIDYCEWRSSIQALLHRGPDGNFSTDMLVSGQHTITFSVLDNHGFWSENLSFSLNITGRPTAFIDSISPSPALEDAELWLNGSAVADGNVNRYVWKSSLDGELHNDSYANFSTFGLSRGVHTISFLVQDENDFWSHETATTTLIITEQPEVDDFEIAPSPAFLGQDVWFYYNGTDDGTVTHYAWSSNISGDIYNGAANNFRRDDLPVGLHNLSFRVRDDLGFWSENASTELLIKPLPELFIFLPDGEFNPGDTVQINITYTGGKEDIELWVMYPNWTLLFHDDEGADGNGNASFEIELPGDAPEGMYAVNVSAPFALNQTILRVKEILPPTAIIDSITPLFANPGTLVSFIGHGEEGSYPIEEYLWASSIDGELEDKSSFVADELSLGHHIISFKVKDENELWSEEVTLELDIVEPGLEILDVVVPANVGLGENLVIDVELQNNFDSQQTVKLVLQLETADHQPLDPLVEDVVVGANSIVQHQLSFFLPGDESPGIYSFQVQAYLALPKDEGFAFAFVNDEVVVSTGSRHGNEASETRTRTLSKGLTSFSLEVDRENVMTGKEITITADLSEGDFEAGTAISFEILDPLSVLKYTRTFVTDGSEQVVFTLKTREDFDAGDYTIYASCPYQDGAATAERQFQVKPISKVLGEVQRKQGELEVRRWSGTEMLEQDDPVVNFDILSTVGLSSAMLKLDSKDNPSLLPWDGVVFIYLGPKTSVSLYVVDAHFYIWVDEGGIVFVRTLLRDGSRNWDIFFDEGRAAGELPVTVTNQPIPELEEAFPDKENYSLGVDIHDLEHELFFQMKTEGNNVVSMYEGYAELENQEGSETLDPYLRGLLSDTSITRSDVEAAIITTGQGTELELGEDSSGFTLTVQDLEELQGIYHLPLDDQSLYIAPGAEYKLSSDLLEFYVSGTTGEHHTTTAQFIEDGGTRQWDWETSGKTGTRDRYTITDASEMSFTGDSEWSYQLTTSFQGDNSTREWNWETTTGPGQVDTYTASGSSEMHLTPDTDKAHSISIREETAEGERIFVLNNVPSDFKGYKDKGKGVGYYVVDWPKLASQELGAVEMIHDNMRVEVKSDEESAQAVERWVDANVEETEGLPVIYLFAFFFVGMVLTATIAYHVGHRDRTGEKKKALEDMVKPADETGTTRSRALNPTVPSSSPSSRTPGSPFSPADQSSFAPPASLAKSSPPSLTRTGPVPGWTCSSCGFRVADDKFKFCIKCGRPRNN